MSSPQLGPELALSPQRPALEIPTEDTSVRRKAAAGLSANVVQLAAALTTAAILARALGPDLLGQYYLLYTVTITLSLFSSLGLEVANSVFIGRREEDPGRLHAASILLALALGGASTLGAWILHPLPALGLVDRVHPTDLAVSLCTVPLILYQNLVYSIFLGTGHLVLTSRARIGIAALRFLGDMTAVSLGLGVSGLVSSFLITSSLGALGLFLAARPFAVPRPNVSHRLLGRLTRFGLKSHLGTLANQIHFRADTFILNAYHGTSGVGVYSVAVQLAELPWLFFGAIQSAVFSRITGAERREAEQLMAFLVRLGVALWLLCLVGGAALVPPLMTALLGPEYEASGAAFSLLIAGTSAVGVSRLTLPYFVGQLRRPTLTSLVAWMNVALNVGLCLVLIPDRGVLGAALASLTSYTAGLVTLLWLYMKMSGLPPSEVFRPRPGDLAVFKECWRSLRGGDARATS